MIYRKWVDREDVLEILPERNPLYSRDRMSKSLYKSWDHIQRYERWVCKELLKIVGITWKQNGG